MFETLWAIAGPGVIRVLVACAPPASTFGLVVPNLTLWYKLYLVRISVHTGAWDLALSLNHECEIQPHMFPSDQGVMLRNECLA